MTQPDMKADPLIAVARIGAPRGVGGFLKLHSYSGEYAHLESLTEVLAAPRADGEAVAPRSGGGTAAPSAPKTLVVTGSESGSWGLALRFKGYESPEAARALTGLELLLPRSKGSPLGPGEWYIADLVGMDLVLEGKKVARIAGVLDGAADPLLECALPEGRTVLVPFRKEFIGEVDSGARTMVLIHGWILE